ncbi:site-specific DNA-methyltransferase [Sphingomonas sp. KC8]|uniref:site-specific DNA-methyltransferase n=1 Tax=Sphingomonas sp. KC8 TaxID=1030157 RepID=UPI0003085B2E|nr:site-specific DNA-methyltransferase [Sphingomonas sp. KC8]ARS27580.1 DNA methylase N-4/N-6 domain-containing protein [Sphingomonas sp. KC8]
MPEIKKLDLNDPATQSADIVNGNIQALEALFPEAFKEGGVDFDVLKQLLGGAINEKDEKYGLNWHGKRKAQQSALTPSTGTLLPCPDESVEWGATQNLMIEGDNLEVLKLLQKSFSRKVKAIYIDPPYNTGRNIVYPNDFSDPISAYLELTGQVDGGQKLTSNPETSGRFHSNWLSMIYPRLKVAKNLLSNDGVLFCTIDENEHASLSLVIKEIFGEGNYEHAYISIVHNPRGQQGKNISYVHENAIVVYPADQKKYLADVLKDEVDSRGLRDSGTESDRTDARNCFYPFIVKDGVIIDIGQVPENSFHPESCNVKRPDGTMEIWPMTDDGDEKKWRYARDSVEKILDKLEPKMGRTNVQIIFHKDSGTMRSVWQNARYDSSEYGTKLVESMIGEAGFTFPKSLWSVYDAVRVMTEHDPDAIVLDFFAGSGTTGHAVWKLNQDIGGNRRFILVQLPEAIEEGNKEQKIAAQFLKSRGRPLNIAEITKERLRASAKKVKEEGANGTASLGFRNFKLASSNISAWQPDPSDLEGTLLANTEHLVPGRTEQDVLYELLLKLGLDLCVPIEKKHIAGKAVHSIGGGALIVCLADGLATDTVETVANGIVAWWKALAPAVATRVVFKDSGFADDVAKANMAAILNQSGILDVRSL